MLACVASLSIHVTAQKLAIRHYQTADGLPHNNVKRILQDAKGYLWVATHEGLGRFDGYGFNAYGTDDGLGHAFINDMAIDREGNLWVATNGAGISRFIDDPPESSSVSRKKFESFFIADGGEGNSANLVNGIVFDTENRMWCVTDSGIYRSNTKNIASNQFERVIPGSQTARTNDALLDSRGRLWFSMNGEPIQIIDGTQITRYEIIGRSSGPDAEVHTIIENSDGQILAADSTGVYQFIETADAHGGAGWRKLEIPAINGTIFAIASSPNGGVWIGGFGLFHFRDGRTTKYTTANGLSADVIEAISYDRDGNLWLGTNGGGLSKMPDEGVVSYTVDQGLPLSWANKIIEDQSGRIYAQVGCQVLEITGEEKIRPIRNGGQLFHPNCGVARVLFQDQRGNWWFSTRRGLEFSSEIKLNLLGGTLVTDQAGDPVGYSTIYDDGDGAVWLSDLDTGKVYKITEGNVTDLRPIAEGMPAEQIIRDARSGVVWLAGRVNVWRIIDGRVIELENIEGLPILQPRSLFQDSRGRVWIGTRYSGAIVTGEPNDAQPQFRHYTTADGLASDTIWEIAEDGDGRIFFGTGRGMDQLDVETGKIRHFDENDGAVGSLVDFLLRDRLGRIWAASANGITRIDPRNLRVARQPVEVLFNRIRIAGEPLPLAETGSSELAPADFSAAQNNIAISFVGVSFKGENALRYQYKLDGSGAEWSQPSPQREVNFANLGSGSYVFLVQAITADGIVSTYPAKFEFNIAAPFWQRLWFIAAVLALITFAIYTFYRYRLLRLLEIERMRMRIATDLHDDIGSNLTKISILSEVVKQRSSQNDHDHLLTSIADISRESVSAMSDIVWAITPKRDSLQNLVRRMRQYAEETCEQCGLTLEFDAKDNLRVKLEADIRRNVYLIFKELLNNVVRHANATALAIEVGVAGNTLEMSISDNGAGFDNSREFDGNGLPNMKKRATEIGGTLSIESDNGTTSVLRVPLERVLWK